MTFDFAALLVLLTVASGIIWGLDSLFFARGRKASAAGEAHPEPLIVDYARSLFPVFLIVLVLRSFIIEPFRIPSASMMPTLLRGDFILVNKYDYGVRLPVLNAKVFGNGKPRRGDVVVFRYPEDPTIPFIKRVVGVPGDHLQYKDKSLTINGVEVDLELKGIYRSNGVGKRENGSYRLAEKLGERDHDILINPLQPSSVVVDRKIPEGHYFVLGDNRDNSRDSRYWGLVPDENLVGRAFYIWMNWSNDSILDPGSWDVDWDRIGSDIN
ncbi:MAG: signal peptidase I [Gammaproteobacteria bacterium]|nr:signal peptidase I [Gammaproteobacteria bacterium]